MARSLVFAMIGLFLLYAALDSNSREAKGFAGALRLIRQQPHGSRLLGITAAGLLAFGIYGVAEAAFGRTPRLLRTTPGSRTDEERKRCPILQA